jgi:hypothetical protein
VGFSAIHDVLKVILYSFKVNEIADVEFQSKLGRAQLNQNNEGLDNCK